MKSRSTLSFMRAQEAAGRAPGAWGVGQVSCPVGPLQRPRILGASRPPSLHPSWGWRPGGKRLLVFTEPARPLHLRGSPGPGRGATRLPAATSPHAEARPAAGVGLGAAGGAGGFGISLQHRQGLTWETQSVPRRGEPPPWFWHSTFANVTRPAGLHVPRAPWAAALLRVPAPRAVSLPAPWEPAAPWSGAGRHHGPCPRGV